ncbi:MAG: hypothetical protein M3Y12_09180, partial [Bacteroidota bacterium]|nr:hypothetical protein [Bacteroidota bacterium]
GALALWGCEKVAPAELSPAAVPVSQSLTQASVLTPAQAAWQDFVSRVERGEIKDPVGQYVAKTTKAMADAGGHRLVRPKVDVLLRDASKGYALRAGQRAGAGAATNVIDEPCVSQDYDPCGPCYNGPGGCGGGGGLYSTFTTSKNLGGGSYIHDLKLVEGNENSTSTTSTVGAGYTKLYADLNKGAGGAYVYLCFQRNPNQVLNGVEYTYNYPYSGPNEVLTAFQTQYGSFTNSTPKPDPYFYSIWVPNQNPNVYWDRVDLNAGAGGDYIYSFQAKSPFVPNYRVISQVGILSGNSSTINPPAGWVKYPKDLNEGAGENTYTSATSREGTA